MALSKNIRATYVCHVDIYKSIKLDRLTPHYAELR